MNHFQWLALPIALATACGGSTGSGVRTVERQAVPAKPVAPAWAYYPDRPQGLRARMDLGDATLLFVGNGGERWLVQARAGSAEAAPLLADEDLVALTHPSDKQFSFIGSKGSIYLAETALGPFTDVRSIEPAPQRVAAAGRTIVALHWDGTAVRSDDGGRTFQPVPVQGNRMFDVALAPDGRAMMLSYPEELWLSRDVAAMWQRSTQPPVGAGFVALDAAGSLVARGVRESLSWRSAKGAQIEVAERPFEQPPLDLLTDLEAGPRGAALVAGRAAITDDSYFEVAREGDEGPWSLAKGSLTSRLQWSAVPDSDECKRMFLGTDGHAIALGCLSGGGKDRVLFPSLRILFSKDRGETFSKRASGLVADDESMAIAVLGDGSLLVTGACKPAERGMCSPTAPIRLERARESKSLQFASTEPSKVPPILGRVGPVCSSSDGKRLYATALLAARRRHAILISDDGGETFRAVPLDFSKVQFRKSKNDSDDAGDDAGDDAAVDARPVDMVQPGTLRVGGDGSLSWVFYTPDGPLWLVFDRSARLLSTHWVPEEQPFLEAVGRHGVAYGADDGRVLESNDGGATFHKLAKLPQETIVVDETPRLWCGVAGCVFGDVFARAGWGPLPGGLLDRERPKEEVPKPKPSTPIVCEVISAPEGTLEGLVGHVGASASERGSAAWSALMVDPKTASVRVAHGVLSPRLGVQISTLFAPAPDPSGIAMAVRPQAEGSAAIRYRFKKRGTDGVEVGSPMRNVEVAWENLFEGPPRRATIPDAGVVEAEDVQGINAQTTANANPAMLSVAMGGIYVCPHGSCGPEHGTLVFLSGPGRSRVVAAPSWPTRTSSGEPLRLSHHLLRANGKDVFVSFVKDKSVVLRARKRDDGGYDFPALGLLPWDAGQRKFQEALSWSFAAPNSVGLTHSVFHTTRAISYARLLRFDGDEPVARIEPAPTQADLSDPPVACDAATRQNTFRVVSPDTPGTSRPVIVTIDAARRVLLTSGTAVLHGKPESACALTVDASNGAGSSRGVDALIPLHDMDHAWLFERTGSSLRWRTMRCRFDPTAKVEGVPTKVAVLRAGKSPATARDCDEVFDAFVRIVIKETPNGMSAQQLESGRVPFRSTCTGKPVDMGCVRAAATTQELSSRCIDLSAGNE